MLPFVESDCQPQIWSAIHGNMHLRNCVPCCVVILLDAETLTWNVAYNWLLSRVTPLLRKICSRLPCGLCWFFNVKISVHVRSWHLNAGPFRTSSSVLGLLSLISTIRNQSFRTLHVFMSINENAHLKVSTICKLTLQADWSSRSAFHLSTCILRSLSPTYLMPLFQLSPLCILVKHL